MAFALSGTDIIQSGTDASLSGLSAIAGVVTMAQGAEKTYNLGNLTLNINGTLSQDPDFEHLIFDATNTRAHDIIVSGGGTWNLGVATVVNGFTKYSTGDAVISQRNIPTFGGGSYQLLSGSATILVSAGGTWNYRGGYIRLNHTIFITSTGKLNMFAGVVQLAGNVRRFGLFSTGAVNFYGGTLDGVQLLVQTFPTSFSGVQFIDDRGITIESSGNRSLTNIFSGLSLNGSLYDCYVWFGALLNFRNSSKGSGIIINGDNEITNPSTTGIVLATQDVTVTLANQASAAINGAVAYIRDTNNGTRYSGYTTFDYTADQIYINSTGVSGATPVFDVLLGEVVKPVYTVSSPFDIRGNTNVPGADLFDVYTLAYNYQPLLFSNAKLQSTSTLNLSGTMLTDTYVTLTESNAVTKLASSFSVDQASNTITVTANSSLDDLYDVMKVYKTRAVQTQLEYPSIGVQPVTANGSTAYTAMNIVVNNGVTLSSGTQFTSLSTSGTFTSAGVIATGIVGSVTTTGTFASGASVTGNVTQATPTNLSGVTITGSLTYNSAAATVTFTNCNVSGVISNSGSGLVKIVKAGTTPWLTGGTNVSVIASVIVETPGGLALSTYIIKNGSTDLGWVATNAARSLEIQESDTFSIYAIAYGYKAKLISATATDLTSFKFELLPEPYIDTSLSTVTRDFITSKFSTALDAYNRIALSLDYDLRYYTPDEVTNAVQWYITTEGDLIAAGVLYGGTIDGVEIIQGGIVIGTPGFYGKVNDSVTTTTNLGILIPIYIDVLPAVYVADPTYTPVLKNSSGIVLQTAPWTKMTADISALDKTDIREGLALEASLALKADQATVVLIPTNPLLTTDARLNTLDVAVSTRLAASGYTAPTTPPTAAQNATAVRSELTTELDRMDVAVSSRLAASGYIAPTTAPTAAQNATAVRGELATELARIDTAVSTRLAASGYTAPTAAPTSAQNATAVRSELAVELGRIDSTVSSRLAASGYTVPDNVSIAAIKATTDATLDTTVSSRLAASGYIAPTTSPTAAQNATAVRSELAIELARIDAAITTRLAASGYTPGTTAPTSAEVATAVRAELALELARVDVAVSTRLAASGYTPGTNAPTSEEVAAAVRTELAAELARIDAGVSTRLAASGYTSPDNASIASIKNVTALIPALL